MSQIGAQKEELAALLSRTTDPAQLADAGRKLKSLDEELHTIEERWLQLTEQIDNIG
jgi:ATP-binding cassette subfamily F protein 3